MKLLYITNGINGIGGLERVLSIKCSYFADKLGHDVHIITLNEGDVAPFYSFSERIKFHSVLTSGRGLKYLQSYTKEINKIVSLVQPDVISVCDDGLKGLYIPIWIKKGNSALIYERHASMKLNNSRLQTILMKIGGLLYDKVVVLTQYNTTEWLGKNKVVIPNPITFTPNEKASLKEKRIICVGSIAHHKGYDLLIDAWRQIAKSCPEWKIDIFGKGDSSELQEMIDEYHLQDNIHFCGTTNNVKQELLHSSFLVLPSRSEGFGMVLIEAMACGLPCVAFDCPCGPRDIIENGKSGFLIPPENSTLLAEGIKKMISDTDKMNKMGDYAFNSVSQYLIENVAERWQNLFQKVIKKEHTA